MTDYATFLKYHDLYWNKLPKRWENSPFLGNGLLGCMLYQKGSSSLRIDMGHSLVYDHRKISEFGDGNNLMYSRCRLPIGHFTLSFAHSLQHCQLRLDLFNALLEGEIKAASDTMVFESMIHTRKMLYLIYFPDVITTPCTMQFVPAAAESPRQSYGIKYKDTTRIQPDYQPAPAPVMKQIGNIDICTQDLEGGWKTVTAWRQIKTKGGLLFAATVTHGRLEQPLDEALTSLNHLDGTSYEELKKEHCDWWNNYYKRSFLSIPDPSLESFYWIQMYKLACATRHNRPIMDNQGPWLQETPWPGIWWNLNVQLAYSPVFAANHCDLFESVWRTLKQYQENLISNVAPEYRHDSAGVGTSSDYELHSKVSVPGKNTTGLVEIGNLIWVLHSYWQYYRMNIDKDFLKNELFPLLKRAVSYSLHFVYFEDDAWHLMPTASPEYGVVAPDSNYEIALLRWGLQTLIYIDSLQDEGDEQAAYWQEVYDHLTPYVQDEAEGFLIAADTHYTKSHRHYSHLLMAYPLYMVTCEQDGAREIVKKTVAHWQSMPDELQGYSFTGASSICSAFGDGDMALSYLGGLWQGFLCSNTFYRESGPVIETPLSAARSLQDMLLQSWGGKIRVFPAVPSKWEEASFENMRAEGAFLVSAVRKHGHTQFVRIQSLQGEPCILLCEIENIQSNRKDIAFSHHDGGHYEIALPKGESIIFFRADYTGSFTIDPVTHNSSGVNSYGYNDRTDLIIAPTREDNRIM